MTQGGATSSTGSGTGASASGPDPLLSVIVTIIDGGAVLRRFLTALTTQQDPPPLEILVPYDASIAETGALAREFPTVRFLDLGEIGTDRPIASAAGQHELYDRRRARGLAAAQGELVAILEDRGAPRQTWARNLVHQHEQPYGVIGGAIECAPSDTLNWAFYVCDFGKYGLPFASGPAAWVSDINVSYKRKIVDETRELWQDRFREPIVHWALLERGETLYLSSEVVVEHGRPATTLRALLPERFHWGRLFGHIRATHSSLPKRLGLALAGPLIPPLLLLRHGRTQMRKGNLGRFLRAAPTAAILLAAWTTGEVWGYLTNRA
jgi:hypothetical protein